MWFVNFSPSDVANISIAEFMAISSSMHIFKMHRLDKIAVNSAIETCAALDGEKFTNHVSHVTCCLNIVDIRATDPKTNELLLNFQSRDLSFVCKSHLMKDTKNGYDHFKGFFLIG